MSLDNERVNSNVTENAARCILGEALRRNNPLFSDGWITENEFFSERHSSCTEFQGVPACALENAYVVAIGFMSHYPGIGVFAVVQNKCFIKCFELETPQNKTLRCSMIYPMVAQIPERRKVS